MNSAVKMITRPNAPRKKVYLYLTSFELTTLNLYQLSSIMPNLHSLPEGTWPKHAFRNNGPDNLVLERAKLRELAEGWPCYR